MGELVAHSRCCAAFLVYLQLYRNTHGFPVTRLPSAIRCLRNYRHLQAVRPDRVVTPHRTAPTPTAQDGSHRRADLYGYDTVDTQEKRDTVIQPHSSANANRKVGTLPGLA
jgi:hypothetical protein